MGEDEANRAIRYLVEHDLMVKWDFPDDDPPPDGIRQLLMSYFSDGEIERTTAGLLRDFLVSRLREDHRLPMDERRQSGRTPLSRSLACRVVRDDE